jgi:MFS family permease
MPFLCNHSMTRTLTAKYYLYKATTSVGFPNPIWQLFLLSRGLTFTQIFALDVLYRVAILIGETPTGYLGDRFGRRTSMLASSAIISLSVLGFGLADSFWTFSGIYVLWALGTTLHSGSASAWLYDSLANRAATDTFAEVRGRGNSAQLLVAGGSAVLGGYLASRSLLYPFLASSVVTALGVGVVLSLPGATDTTERETKSRLSIDEAVTTIRKQLATPPLRSFVVFIGLFYALVFSINTYIQPISVEAGLSLTEIGWMYGGFTLISALVNYNAGRIEAVIGLRQWYSVMPAALGGAFALAAFLPAVFVIPLFFAMRAAMYTTQALDDQYVNDRTGSTSRATVLSAVSMVVSLVIIPIKLLAGPLGDVTSPMVAVSVLGSVLLGVTLVMSVVEPPVANRATTPSTRSHDAE